MVKIGGSFGRIKSKILLFLIALLLVKSIDSLSEKFDIQEYILCLIVFVIISVITLLLKLLYILIKSR